MFTAYRRWIIGLFGGLAVLSIVFTTRIQFSFSFDQFFPQGDEDLEFFNQFKKEFESDDNFLLIAVQNEPDVFDSVFLQRFHSFSLDVRNLTGITQARALTQMDFPVKTPFGYSAVPAIHTDNPEFYVADKEKLLGDDRIVNALIDREATTLVIACKTVDEIDLKMSDRLMTQIDSLEKAYGFDKVYKLGRPYFQKELVDFQKREIMVAFIASIILVTLIMFVLYRKPIGIAISLGSIALGLLLFMGVLGAWGRTLNALSALYPVLMLIVGSSDVIHIFSKYTDELKKGRNKELAMRITIKEIGMATLFTSVTTAIGFATLLTSKLPTVREFGINSAVGVMVAYITVLLFTTSMLSFFDRNQIIAERESTKSRWDQILRRLYILTARKPVQIGIAFALFLVIAVMGMIQISTNYNIESNLPRGAKVTQDFLFFEKNLGGFRPLEFVVSAQNGLEPDGYEVLGEVAKLEQKLRSTGVINNIVSLAGYYTGFEKIRRPGDENASFPESKEVFQSSASVLKRFLKNENNVLLSKEGNKTRISARIADIGADSIKTLGNELDRWIAANLDADKVMVRRTGTGLILDKNAEYVRQNLMEGLGLSLVMISILMGLLFRSLTMLWIALIPNILPMVLAAGLMGYLGIELEAGISIVFALIFGIAVDDSIHFLGRMKLSLQEGHSVEQSIKITFRETGKAIIFTTIVLFFGFFNMVFSINPPTFTIGLLIAVTLVGAVICDLLLLPVLIRKFLVVPART
jgi:predicted RND superfamily exporter protein